MCSATSKTDHARSVSRRSTKFVCEKGTFFSTDADALSTVCAHAGLIKRFARLRDQLEKLDQPAANNSVHCPTHPPPPYSSLRAQVLRTGLGGAFAPARLAARAPCFLRGGGDWRWACRWRWRWPLWGGRRRRRCNLRLRISGRGPRCVNRWRWHWRWRCPWQWR